MNLIKSVNIQFAKDELGETLLSFSTPKDNKTAMERAKKAINYTTNKPVKQVQRNPPEHGTNVWSAYSDHSEHLAWVTLNEVTVKG